MEYPWDQKEFNKSHRFFGALKAGRLEAPRCKKCGEVQWPPRSVCSKCLSDDLEWVELPKEGTLESFHVSHVTALSGEKVPFPVGVIRLANGVRMLARIKVSDIRDLKAGLGMQRINAGLRKGQVTWTYSPSTHKKASKA
ncbi:MAG: Zn-ribbon domain-containing OB-fold protein [Thaumarchaeota archaeon]|nr:Zn-ribbon domain-containing OB-fold protein [Nitrososphaerota archaeon]